MLGAPMFPEFSATQAERTYQYMFGSSLEPSTVYRIETCTLRPPVNRGRGQTFAFYIAVPEGDDPETVARVSLMEKYLKAHPENCANVDLSPA